MLGDDGRPRITDFGIARPQEDLDTGEASLDPSARRTHEGKLVGTPAYMAPEQLHGSRRASRQSVTRSASRCSRRFTAAALQRQDRRRAARGHRPATRPAADHGSSCLARPGARARGARARPLPRLRRTLPIDAGGRRRARTAATACAGAGRARARRLPGGRGDGDRLAGAPRAHARAGASEELRGIWGEPRQASIAAAFVRAGGEGARGTWNAVRGQLDRYAGDWIAARTTSCQATLMRHQQSAHLFDAQMQCLARRKDDLTALVDVLGQVDGRELDAVPRAVSDCAGRCLPGADSAASRDRRAQPPTRPPRVPTRGWPRAPRPSSPSAPGSRSAARRAPPASRPTSRSRHGGRGADVLPALLTVSAVVTTRSR